MSNGQRIAIILHGPPTTGKTSISNEICQRLPRGEARCINLDHGWGGPNDTNDRSRPDGYRDLRDAEERVLIIELSYGEPTKEEIDKGVKGATRGAPDWVKILREAGRKVIPYLLGRHWPDAIRQMLHRHEKGNLDEFVNDLNTFLNYHWEDPDRQTDFPHIEAFEETPILTSGRTCSEVTTEIMIRSGL